MGDFQGCATLLLWAIIFAAIGGVIGDKLRNRRDVGLILGFLLGPIGWALVLLFEDRRRKCPECQSTVDWKAKKCPRCGSTLPAAG